MSPRAEKGSEVEGVPGKVRIRDWWELCWVYFISVGCLLLRREKQLVCYSC